ncbi:MAG TPA: tRNA (adenosine(37)-N6)-threonylcarbamoyltransferase complex ATPase subunit type 1 TsaE [Patescibacteria group bacterium]|jgi:tRNA threonylcarbamoyladenosine biosynthesis protein TsaE|nr:tRNA (adenosine(37)-N6)-threonylcarbamoyltransferase complex ATPase subunit type 1 TsaE [Patescibacteria group bacterium]
MTKLPLSEAQNFAKKLAPKLKGGEIIALVGDLGSGKTTFTKALGKALGIKQNISSPTFVLMQQFLTKNKLHFYHLDLYRTKNLADIKSLGITEWWGRPETITVIEWADKIKTSLPKNTQFIYLYRDEQSNKTNL